MKMTLYENGRAYFDGETFTVCNEPLEIKIETEEDNLYAVCTIGNARTVIRIRDGLSIPPTFLKEGTLYITIEKIENGKILKRWMTEKVNLREIKDEYKVIPELSMLREEVDTLKKALKELYGLIIKNNQI